MPTLKCCFQVQSQALDSVPKRVLQMSAGVQSGEKCVAVTTTAVAEDGRPFTVTWIIHGLVIIQAMNMIVDDTNVLLTQT